MTLKTLAATVLAAIMTISAQAQENHKIAIAAHRGFWKCEAGGGAHNSIASLREAQAINAWGTEFDVHMTKDDVIVVNHDNEIGGVNIQSHDYADIKDMKLVNGETLPTLDQYLDQGAKCPTTKLVLEIKVHENRDRNRYVADKCIEALKAHGLYDPARVMFISFSYFVCERLAEVAPEFTNQYLMGDKTPEELHEAGINGLDYGYWIFDKNPDWVKRAHDLGMSVNAWTVDRPDDIQRMIDRGVDCITTNEPLVTRELLGEKELRNPVAPQIDDPVASDGATVVFGNARFTVLTPRLVRMEWAEDGRFEDRATLGIVNRHLPVPKFTVKKSGKKLTVKTSDLTLTYRGPGNFTAENLSVTFAKPGSKKEKTVWHPGLDDSANLLGTCRTLDGCDGEKTMDPYDKGVISRDGWAVIDESGRHLLVDVPTSWGKWVECRPQGERSDLYMFAYGHDYTAAVSDYIKIAGRIPMPPKYAFGYWWCRYWQYSDNELVDLASHFKSYDIPIDVMIIDMDWHETWSADEYPGLVDESGEWLGWTGYTWKKEFFPNPANHLADLHNFGVKTSLNIHPAAGIQTFEEPYERFVKDYTSRTSDYDGPKGFVKPDGKKTYVPFRIDQQEWADAYMNSVMHPFEKQGVDFWWLDWQQYRDSRYVPGLSNTFWLNYVFFNDMKRRSAEDGIYAIRPMIYHRWGGIGSHRYQVGFSGDTWATWKVLGYLPYFTSTASNVGYGYWGHDIGGHMQWGKADRTDPELYTRWLQSGVFTPIFKTHSTKDMTMEKRFWVFPDHFDAMRQAVRLRYDLAPYIYNASRQAYETGISMCRPLYYYYPEQEKAYTFTQEYLFGDDILATVVCSPADKVTGLAPRQMWFPEGNDWYDVSTGTTYKGGTEASLTYTIEENPWFVKAGSIIPMSSPSIGSLQEKSDELYLFVAPGDGTSSARVYEDDGATQAYEEEYATTLVSKTSDASSRTLTVEGRTGSYAGMLPSRKVRVVLDGILAPSEVKVDGKVLEYNRFAAHQQSGWGYDGNTLSVTVYVPSKAASEATVVEVKYAPADRALANGRKGLIKRAMALTPEVKYHFAVSVDGSKQIPKAFLNISQCGSFMTEDPASCEDFLKALNPSEAVDLFGTFPGLPSDFVAKVRAQLL
ncbi:MAG: DUF5110 domain-containing protein [Bacteroidales bacterium]|nr:DUF5110 domain-containing protein [Bacteroidales bacterium]